MKQLQIPDGVQSVTFNLLPEIKEGKRNSKEDISRIQKAHDAAMLVVNALRELGALEMAEPENEGQPPMTITNVDSSQPQPLTMRSLPDEEESLVAYGNEVKSLGGGKIGGYLVVFSSERDPDLAGDYFTKSTNFGIHNHVPVYYAHTLDKQLKDTRLGIGTIKADEVGVWVEAQLDLREDYEKAVLDLAEKGKLGWSSGSAGHLVRRKVVGKSYELTDWPLVEASLTPIPAEPRTLVVPLKSLKGLPPFMAKGKFKNGDKVECELGKGEVISVHTGKVPNVDEKVEGTEDNPAYRVKIGDKFIGISEKDLLKFMEDMEDMEDESEEKQLKKKLMLQAQAKAKSAAISAII